MKTNMNFNLFTPTKLLFGCGKLNELGNQSMPGKKALLLISNGQSVRRPERSTEPLHNSTKRMRLTFFAPTFTKIPRKKS